MTGTRVIFSGVHAMLTCESEYAKIPIPLRMRPIRRRARSEPSTWTVESIEVMNILTYGGAYVISHPMHIYQRWLRGFFTYIVPAIFLNYYPSLYILGKTDPLGIPAWGPFVAPVAGVGVLLAAVGFWRFGIRNYQSTGT